jgi:ubiquinone/menaquinone biosynthesis C-methylase UbiE
MRLALREIKRVLRPEGYCILVIGNNIIFKRVMPNNQILAEIAQEEGFELKTMLVDEIRSRGLITKRHETAGMIADEWIILLQNPASLH